MARAYPEIKKLGYLNVRKTISSENGKQFFKMTYKKTSSFAGLAH